MKKLNIAVLLLAFGISACDSERESNNSEPADSMVMDVSKTTGTAIYLPGGGGVDFGRSPVRSSVISDRGIEHQLVVYEFDEGIEVLDQALSKLLMAEGYERNEEPDATYKLRVVYHKEGFDKALFRYAIETREGFTRKTKLVMWWRKR